MLKTFRRGTERAAPPRETIERVARHAREFGITRVANVTGRDLPGIPVVMVVRPNSRSVSVSQGKGITLEAARASGLMEAAELYHAENIEAPLRFSSFEDLRRRVNTIEVARLPRLDTSGFHERLKILWIEGRDLLNERSVWLPLETVDADYTLPRLTGAECFPANTTGLASGNHPLEAISHAICEGIERHSMALWSDRSDEERAQTRVDPATVDDADCGALLECLTRCNFEAGVFDITSPIGVPAFLCRILPRGDRWMTRPIVSDGMGCHPSPAIALIRAVTEAAQSRLSFVAGSRDDLTREEYEKLQGRLQMRYAEGELAGPCTRSFTGARGWHAETFEEDIERLKGLLQDAGMRQIAVVDLAKEQFGLPVVRVVIPGLRGMTTGRWETARYM